METLAILMAGPAGYFRETRKRGLIIYLALWAIVFPVSRASGLT